MSLEKTVAGVGTAVTTALVALVLVELVRADVGSGTLELLQLLLPGAIAVFALVKIAQVEHRVTGDADGNDR